MILPSTIQMHLKQLYSSRDLDAIATAIADTENARESQYNSPAQCEAIKLRSILASHQYNLQNTSEVYHFLIQELEHGKLREIVNALAPYRREQGYALPHPTEYLMEDLAFATGLPRPFEQLNLPQIRELIYSPEWSNINRTASALRPRIYTTTGFGRNADISPVLKKVWKGGTYIEVGGSWGAHAF